MQRKTLHRIVATLIFAASVGLIGCGGGASGEPSASTRADAGGVAPSGAYESRLPDGTVMRLSFLNGEVILVEGGEGMTMQLSWRGNALVTDFGGATLTFNKV
jgi:hypothetical protein